MKYVLVFFRVLTVFMMGGLCSIPIICSCLLTFFFTQWWLATLVLTLPLTLIMAKVLIGTDWIDHLLAD